MEYALEIRGLCKQYDGFALRDVDITLPRGSVIGENGAGKTTTIKAILGLIRQDAGSIRVLGMDSRQEERAVKERIGVVLEDGCFLNTLSARQVNVLMGKAYRGWQPEQFFGCMRRFGIDLDKKIKDYSKGMRMKVSIAAALSHGAELLIMDEPTSGLDPVVRDEVLDLFYEFMQEESHAMPCLTPTGCCAAQRISLPPLTLRQSAPSVPVHSAARRWCGGMVFRRAGRWSR